MNWFYALDGERRAGPVEDGEFNRLVQAGTITEATLVWHSGLSTWYPYAVARAASTANPAAAFPGTDFASTARASTSAILGPGQVRCSECAQVFADDEVVRIEGLNVCGDCKPLLVQKLREGIRPAGAGLVYAGFWIRFSAVAIDGFMLSVIAWAVNFGMALTLGVLNREPHAMRLIFWLALVVNVLIGVAYESLSITNYGATPGKMACGLKVVRPDGSPIPFGRSVGRHFAKFLSAIIFTFGYIMAVFDSEKRTLHDQICDTRVIRK